MDGDGQALLAVEGSSANDDPLNRLCARLKARRATKTHELFMLLLLLPFVFMCTSLHQALRGQASDQYHDRFVKYGTTATSANWDVLRRASARSQTYKSRWIWVSMKPGEISRPPRSIVSALIPESGATAAIRPASIATSPARRCRRRPGQSLVAGPSLSLYAWLPF